MRPSRDSAAARSPARVGGARATVLLGTLALLSSSLGAAGAATPGPAGTGRFPTRIADPGPMSARPGGSAPAGPAGSVESDGAARVGTISGTVRIGRTSAAPPPRLSPYARRRYSPPADMGRQTVTVDEVVVYVPVPGIPGAGPAGTSPPPGPVVVTQRDRTIIPHVTVVQAGTRIAFPNDDDVFHNLFSLSDPHPFNLGRYPPGDSRSETFENPGVVRMFCDIHSEMTAVIRVLATPHFVQPDATGRFRLTEIPEGTVDVVAWHPDLGADTMQVTVSGVPGEPLLLQIGR